MRVLFAMLLASASAWGCSCAGYPSAKGAWQEASLVFAGVVEKTKPRITSSRMDGSEQIAWVRVTEAFKGVAKDQVVELRDEFSSCFGGFRDGTALLFYVHPGQKKDTWNAWFCGRTTTLANADHVRFLRGLPASARGNRISGTVELYDDDPMNGFRLNRRMAGVRVRAVSETASYEATTDASGLYEFRDLRPGMYTIAVDYPQGTRLRFPIAYGVTLWDRFAKNNEGTRLEVTSDSHNGFSFNLAADTRIQGRVLDPQGRAMKGVRVELEPAGRRSDDGSTISDYTEADGSYALEMMTPGTYRVVANPGGVKSAAAPFGRLPVPGTVTVVAGRPVTGLDIQAPELARRIELRGRLVFADGVPVANRPVYFRPRRGQGQESAQTDAQGKFVMQVLAGQQGHLTAEIYLMREAVAACPHFQTTTLKATPLAITGDADRADIEVKFRVASCGAWPAKR